MIHDNNKSIPLKTANRDPRMTLEACPPNLGKLLNNHQGFTGEVKEEVPRLAVVEDGRLPIANLVEMVMTVVAGIRRVIDGLR